MLRAAGIAHRRVYDFRATFATCAVESGVELLYFARIMRTSVAQIEDTYARWLTRTDAQLRTVLDAYDAKARSTARSAAASLDNTGFPETLM